MIKTEIVRENNVKATVMRNDGNVVLIDIERSVLVGNTILFRVDVMLNIADNHIRCYNCICNNESEHTRAFEANLKKFIDLVNPIFEGNEESIINDIAYELNKLGVDAITAKLKALKQSNGLADFGI